MKIEAFFSGIKNANSAVEKLKAEGFNKSVVDLNDHYVEYNDRNDPPKAINEAGTLSSLVLNSGGLSDDVSKRPLAAASPMVSGMGGFEEITDVNYRVIVNLEDKDADKAKDIIKNAGGDLNNPNLDLPHRLEDIHPKL
ncbi:hypothetical protein Ccar_14655 [Clostridium carboxidivorans P7]|uniref:Uncharacterized protein n=1 Tax=Clostridium carboxidivorans P7 TaxID=536227 RepID=C6Q0Q7_9CLOT|nr:hypothetical protein [Clostridium carboxidivorans]AKN32037.1 hypothetical protein Ccar_14655 [Clostridium carboxidivorans P7]EET84911.1 conserved hypothetical protein [Clostridium carboxidivorans P7]EFG87821.1 hypothetical protein CLCAR_2422 [Clostridium carboxidivorans P7]